MDNYQKFIALSRYARHIDGENRRETWDESVSRYTDYMYKQAKSKGNYKIDPQEWSEIHSMIIGLEVMPSMRAMMSAGPALNRDNVAGYNCAYCVIDHPSAFDEIMYILMCGTGVGFSVERQYVSKLPSVADKFHPTETTIKVNDSKLGWANAFRELVSMLYNGRIPKWDISDVRPAGARLRTFGGRASGPGPLVELFNFTTTLFKKAKGRPLNSLECHDLVCKIGQVVVVGGVRRSAMISLSNLTDDRMRRAKNGSWYQTEPQRSLSNNSVCYTEKPDFEAFMKEMVNLFESRSGERGIFYRGAAQAQAGKSGRRNPDIDFGTNPCSEIILRPDQFCNLTEVVVREGDTLSTLRYKVRAATILGTIQSTLTDFRYLRDIWKKNTEEERLLGVSLTGIMDHPVLSGLNYRDYENDEIKDWLNDLRDEAISTNAEWAARLGISASVAITCVKPSGTVSQLVDSSSGIHPRFSDFYIRTVRGDIKDPLSQFMIENGVPNEVDVMNPTNVVFSFPKTAPMNSIKNEEMCALEQLELWKIYSENWCEHKPSQTVYYTPDEFFDICSWVWNNFEICSGISFLPLDDHIYQQAPYQKIDGDEYDNILRVNGKVPWEEFNELEDGTLGSQTFACMGEDCEQVDI
jgi:ribonucleoside-triphosphate reductase (thioredoxin)